MGLFTNLIERASGHAPVVERRIPSRFEPSRERAGSPEIADVATEAPVAHTAMPAVQTPAAHTIPNEGAAVPPIREQTVDRESPRADRKAMRETHRESFTEITKIERVVERLDFPTSPPMPAVMRRREDAALPGPKSIEPKPGMAVPAVQAKATPKERDVMTPVQARPAAPPAPRAPSQRTRQEAARNAAQTAQETSAAPTIHITIGRIEVRAAQPAATTKSTRSRGPRLSLDDYLNSRAEGSR